ncbi:MAG: nucleotide sugar dehydrogenase [Candidatus Omnitrophica bacterium]|nr:nucleotide sugar dehydrogenase [Candidatus Omnitrophota bacterium]MBU1933607.1 nucleotide sugar dehydrogenase [Candidatus Omnitrophota bacterium]
MKNKKRIAVFGLGYVGTVTGSCLAKKGHIVVGVDINSDKVRAINKGRSPIIEKDLDGVISSAVKRGRFSAVSSAEKALSETDIAIICVGTPAAETGSINLESLKSVAKEIGLALKRINRFYTIVVRSTVLPGTTEDILIPILEDSSGKRVDRDFGISTNPEFMREGDSLEDFYRPAKTIVGVRTRREEILFKEIFSFLKKTHLIITDVRTAEMCKYLDNIFHALKISFANEIGLVAGHLGVDGKKAMEIFCEDTVSNISARYLKPAFAFGGSCLPKDIKAFLYKAKNMDLKIPLIESILESNDACIQRVFREILKTGKKKIGLLGLSFKPGTDDLRESQLVRLAELLIGKGFSLKIYDRNVSLARITGTNRAYIEKEIPHIASLLCKSVKEALRGSDVVVIGHGTRAFKGLARKLKKGQILINLSNR